MITQLWAAREAAHRSRAAEPEGVARRAPGLARPYLLPATLATIVVAAQLATLPADAAGAGRRVEDARSKPAIVRPSADPRPSGDPADAPRRRARAGALEDPRPDIIVIMADDIGAPGIGPVLSRMPNIRRVFVEGGVRLTEMHGEMPLCTPGRANTLTGQHSLHNGVVRNDGDALRPRGTIAFRLQRAGYHTMLGGKYLNNYSGRRVPLGWDRAKFLFPDAEGRLGQLAARWLTEAPADAPVFAWFASSAAHKRKHSWHARVLPRFHGAPECQGIPSFKPPTYQAWRKPKAFPRNMPYWPDGWHMTSVCESMLQVDELVGMVAEAQAARGRPAHLIFMADNGMAWGQKGYPGKHVPLATRLPFFWSGPGVARGTSSDALLSNIDVAPTIARIAGVTLTAADGQSFRAVLRGKDRRGRGKALTLMPKGKVRWTSVRTHRWHYIRWQDGRRELYDVRRSRWEPVSANLARKRPALVRKLDRTVARMVRDSRR